MTRLPPDLDLIREALTPAAVHRSKARRLELLVVCVVLAAVLTVVFTKPSDAALKTRFNTPVIAHASGTYNHIETCKATLRGSNSDDDVHAWGVKTLAKRFVAWDVGGWHGSDNSAYVVGIFEYSTKWIRWTGRCWNGDYSSDSFGW